jgi:hypothetical protein
MQALMLTALTIELMEKQECVFPVLVPHSFGYYYDVVSISPEAGGDWVFHKQSIFSSW